VPLVGRVFPMSLALLGLAFIACTLLVAGLPPLSGFVAKLSLLSALLHPTGLTPGTLAPAPPPQVWWLFGLLLVSGLGAMVSMARAGIRHFWSDAERPPRHVSVVEGLPVLALILACTWLTLRAEPVMRFTRATAATLHAPKAYVDAVLSTRPVPGPTRQVARGRHAP